MGKRKKTAALFEVISRQTGKEVRVPLWVKAGESTDTVSVEGHRSGAPLKQPPGFDPTVLVSAPMSAPAKMQKVAPVIAIEGSRLKLSLSYISCIVLGLGLIVLLFGFYKLGQATAPHVRGQSEPGGQSAEAMGGPPAVVAGSDYNYEAVQSEATRRWNKGGKFPVIQGLVANMDDARAIQKYLWQAGYAPLISQDANKKLMVLDTLDMTDATNEELSAYAENLERLGNSKQWQLGYNFKHGKQLQLITQTPQQP
ncbi:MAG: hypothetical protein HQ546_09415 [Planctomycetes bacterium]|nr:hypothetical protein [Planctomycetota bacterium]